MSPRAVNIPRQHAISYRSQQAALWPPLISHGQSASVIDPALYTQPITEEEGLGDGEGEGTRIQGHGWLHVQS